VCLQTVRNIISYTGDFVEAMERNGDLAVDVLRLVVKKGISDTKAKRR
jgi:hypothetical protein